MRRADAVRNGFRIAQRLVVAKLTGRRIPLQAWLFLTDRCNADCFYCFTRPHTRGKREMSTQQVTALVDDLARMGTIHFILIGGEPLLRDDIGQIVGHVRRHRGIVELRTNGYLVAERLDEIRGVDSLCISLDGDEETNDLNRGPGAFRRAMRGIEAAVGAGLNVHLHGVVTRHNLHRLEYLARLARDLRVHVSYNNARVEGGDPERYLSDEELRQLYRECRRLKAAGYPILTHDLAYEYVIGWPFPYRKVFGKNEAEAVRKAGLLRCNLTSHCININADGYVYPCGSLFGSYGANLHEVGLQRAWEHLADAPCLCCADLGCVFNSMAFSLKPRYVLETLKVALRNYRAS